MSRKPYRTHMGLERLLSYSRLAQLRDERRRPSFRGVPLVLDDPKHPQWRNAPDLVVIDDTRPPDLVTVMNSVWKKCADNFASPDLLLVTCYGARIANRVRTGIWPRRIRHRNPRRVKLSWLSR